jgi:hypothetical protein
MTGRKIILMSRYVRMEGEKPSSARIKEKSIMTRFNIDT